MTSSKENEGYWLQFPPSLPPNNMLFLKQLAEVTGQQFIGEDLKDLANEMGTTADSQEVGYFGNIWVRQLNLPKKGDYHRGHRHHYDHITLVAKGAVRCEIPNLEPKDFYSPTFITIKADDWHKFTALEDNTVYYCIYAIRNEDGKVVDYADKPIYMEKNTPYPFNQEVMPTDDEVRDMLAKVEFGCGNCGCDKVNDS